ncbi:ATP-grasp domain-containing protein [Streptomyces sp. TS71-3]|uniref:ATP-grasp domain-containing protein n=1 Tax=Streptomyces sp. TS71-3 TaxID=2733862 RepID=UPI001B0875EC|nr:ATP-grasp domain-containing protein [Streptomyces sp. TS71-3]GHJ36889.1 hypothetical protein Sm713_24980 [Streptomyces sp. TS71-3]
MHIVMVEASAPRSFDYVEDLVAAGHEVSFLTESLANYAGTQGFERHKLAARVIEIPGMRDNEDLAAAVRGRLGPHPPDGVLCVHDHYLVVSACLARDLGLPHEPVATLRLLTDKAAVRERLTAAGLGSLRWAAVHTPEEGLSAADAIGYPVVVKPVAGRMSVDVSVVWNAEQAARVLAGALQRAHVKRLLVEEYVAGRAVAAQLLVQHGRPMLLGFGELLPSRADNAVELGGYFPARFEQRGAARRFAFDIVRTLGIRDSALHIEMVLTATGPELIEVNGRAPGYVVPRQMNLALDRSLPLDLAALCTGNRVDEPAEPVAYVALRNLTSARHGTVRSAGVPADLPDAVTDCHLTVRPGDRVRPARANHDRIGYVLAQGFTREAAARAADEAFARIQEGLAVDEAHGEDGDGAHGGRAVHGAGGPGAPAPAGQPAGAGSARTEAAPDDPAARTDRYGPHVVLLLDAGAGGPHPDRVLAAAGAATGHVSVLWCGADQAPPGVRDGWERRYAGAWRHAPGGAGAAEALRELGREHPVAAVVAFAPGLAALRDRLAADASGAAGPDHTAPTTSAPAGTAAVHATAGREAATAPPGPGHLVLCLVAGGTVHHLDVVDDLGSDADGHRTLRCPSALPAAAREGLRAAAERAVTAAGVTTGTVRCFFATGAGDIPGSQEAAPAPVPVAVSPGLDEATRAVHDAAHAGDAVARAVSAALGNPVRSPGPARRAALLRVLAAPPGDFRVVAASTADDLCDHPEVAYAHAPLAAGDVHAGPERAARLSYAVAGPDAAACEAAARRVEASLTFRHTPMDRTHVVIVDRIGSATWTREDGSPLLPPERFRVSVLSGGARVVGPGSAPTDLAVRTDVFDEPEVVRLVRHLHRSNPVHRIAAASERLLAPVAALRESLGLPGDTSPFTRSLVDKAEMKRLARRAGIPHADGRVVYEEADARQLLDRYGAVVLKPRELSGSQGVSVCADPAGLRRWLDERFVPGGFLAERRVSAPMCHIDALVHEGAVVAWDVSLYRTDTLALTRGRPLSSETVDDPVLRERAGALLERVVGAWRMRSATLHLEAFAEGDELVFCEVAGRPGGAGVVPAFVATRGIDLRHAKVLIDAGEDPRTLAREPVAAHAGWVVHYSAGGVLAEFDDSAVAGRAYHRELLTGIGGTVPRSNFSGTGLSTHVFAESSAAEVGRLITAAEGGVRIVMKPLSDPAGTPDPTTGTTGTADPTTGTKGRQEPC